MPQDNNNNVSKGIRVANTVAGLPYTIARGVNDAIQEVNRRLVRRRVRNAPTAATLSLVTGPYLSPIISGLAQDVQTVSSIMHRGKKTTSTTTGTSKPNNRVAVNGTSNQSNGTKTPTNTTRKSTNTTPKSNNNDSVTINGGQLPEVVVIGQRPKSKSAKGQTNTGNRRGGSSRRQQRVNVGGGYYDKAYTPGVGVNPEMIVASPPQGVAIPLSQELVSPTPNIPETIEVPQVSTPGTFTRRDVRNMLRAKGINPYYEIGGLQRRALRRYLNGEPVAGEYQDFINKIMQQ